RWDERPNRSRSRPASHTSGGCMPAGAFFSAFVTAVNLCKLFGQDTGPLQAPGCTAMQQSGQIRLFVSMGWGEQLGGGTSTGRERGYGGVPAARLFSTHFS